MTTESLPVSFSPYINVTLDGMHLMVQDTDDVDTDPEGVPLATVVTITPLVTAGTVIMAGNHGYFPSKMTWLVCPVGWSPPINSSISSLSRVEYPFSENLVNLADPDVITDADSYQIDLAMYDTRLTPPEQVGTAAGTLTCPENSVGPISLLSTIPVSASTLTSAIVRGPANTLSIGEVTTVASGSSASATITGDSPNQVLNLVLPQGTAGESGQDLTRREVRSATTSEYSYIGVAPTSSLETDAVWSIGRISLTGTIVMTNATNVAWTNRASGVYV